MLFYQRQYLPRHEASYYNVYNRGHDAKITKWFVKPIDYTLYDNQSHWNIMIYS